MSPRPSPERQTFQLLRATGVMLAVSAASWWLGCASAHKGGSSALSVLSAEARPIGHGPRFHPPARGPVVGPCMPRLGARFGVHIEVFADNRVMLIAAGIGTRPPRTFSEGRISAAGCYGELATLEPTGVVLVRPGRVVTLSELFREWDQPLSGRRLASFTAPTGSRVAVFVGGRRWSGSPGSVPLAPHREIVLEVGPHIPPHASYTFPPGT